MVNRERLIEEFLELVRVDCISHHERNMADLLLAKLTDMGLEPWEDDAGHKSGGDAGNVLCTVRGNKNVSPILLCAHMDTASPGIGKKPVIEGNMIRSEGNTVLGGDDAAGIECILEAVRTIMENAMEHGDIQLVFTIAEETGLHGSRNLEYKKINAKYAFVLDGSGPIGTITVNAPAQNRTEAAVRGKAAHAGIQPEKGISAIQIAVEAMAGMKLGRLDFETTSNIGTIHGGKATNMVCDLVEIKGEVRSSNAEKLQAQTNHMRECFEKAADKLGGSVEFRSELAYPSFHIDPEAPILAILKKAAAASEVQFRTEGTGGGSDTSILNGNGISAVDLSVGMDRVHSVRERISIEDMVKAAGFLVEIIKNIDH